MRKNNITPEDQRREEYVENDIDSSSPAKWQLLNLFQKILRSYHWWCLCPSSETLCRIFNIFIQWENISFYSVWLLYPNKYKRHLKNLGSMWKTICLLFLILWSDLTCPCIKIVIKKEISIYFPIQKTVNSHHC